MAYPSPSKTRQDHRRVPTASTAPPPPLRPRYIIIGTGPSGCALAAVLAKQQKGLVCLLDMGPEKVDQRKVKNATDWVKASLHSWNSKAYLTTPHKHLRNRVFLNPRGVGPGGSGLVNALQYSRGYVDDYKAWPWKLEDIEKSYANVELSLKKAGALLEGEPGPLTAAFMKAAGSCGLRVLFSSVRPPPPPPSAAATLEKQTGSSSTTEGGPSTSTLDSNLNSNSKRSNAAYYLTSGSYAPMCYVAKRSESKNKHALDRVSPYQAFIQPLLDQGCPHLKVIFNARVTRLLLKEGEEEGKKKTAGLEYLDTVTGKVEQLMLQKRQDFPPLWGGEVIVCAGAIETPKLLLLSGIGNPTHLSCLGIPLAHALPEVGVGLKDHTLVPLVRYQYWLGKRFPFSPNSMHGWVNLILNKDKPEEEMRIALLMSDFSIAPDLAPEIVIPRYPGMFWRALRAFCVAIIWCLLILPPIRWFAKQAIGVLVCLMNPRSQGSVCLRSANPTDPPLIDPAYLSHPMDLSAMQQGLRMADRILTAKALSPFVGPEILPGPFFSYAKNEEATKRYTARYAGSYFHPACTCAMGKVVNERLQVEGVVGLRIADASVLPDLGSAGPYAACMMIGDRLGRLLMMEEEAGKKGR